MTCLLCAADPMRSHPGEVINQIPLTASHSNAQCIVWWWYSMWEDREIYNIWGRFVSLEIMKFTFFPPTQITLFSLVSVFVLFTITCWLGDVFEWEPISTLSHIGTKVKLLDHMRALKTVFVLGGRESLCSGNPAMWRQILKKDGLDVTDLSHVTHRQLWQKPHYQIPPVEWEWTGWHCSGTFKFGVAFKW